MAAFRERVVGVRHCKVWAWAGRTVGRGDRDGSLDVEGVGGLRPVSLEGSACPAIAGVYASTYWPARSEVIDHERRS